VAYFSVISAMSTPATSLKAAAWVLKSSERYQAAQNAAQRVLKLDPDDAWARSLLDAAEGAQPAFGRIKLDAGRSSGGA